MATLRPEVQPLAPLADCSTASISFNSGSTNQTSRRDFCAAGAAAGATAPAAAPAAQKSRRLVWFVDPESKLIEAVEQSARGASGWTAGRNVAMKRLHEQDPRLDYLSDHDRRALRTIRKTSAGWYGQENYDFDPYATLLALVDHPLVYDTRRRDQRLELVSYPVELVVS